MLLLYFSFYISNLFLFILLPNFFFLSFHNLSLYQRLFYLCFDYVYLSVCLCPVFLNLDACFLAKYSLSFVPTSISSSSFYYPFIVLSLPLSPFLVILTVFCMSFLEVDRDQQNRVRVNFIGLSIEHCSIIGETLFITSSPHFRCFL